MSVSVVKTILFSSLVVGIAHAFVPMPVNALPPNLEADGWSALTTLDPVALTASPSEPSAAVAVTPSPDVQVVPALDPNMIPDLKRQVTGQGPAVAATALSQISPITTYYANSMVDGSAVQVPVVYTQTFAPVPDQWPSPTAGEIGLGTIQGTIGVVHSKRDLPSPRP
ncbi:uncharacterized protein PV06_07333 [Exophiala oligosperma]|uniref:Yeast cell wall synthesis Kre9/Knh1 C-terminal domain-containing protein n=1 Tax=Exophiala oligosperma TaxID=215243 RepID=A0A0D2BRL8_9EURO|nr:uncharacterized protein PV06_07333 [Exophiala oligosperma]KIW40102.1 hypothetical protein PV06_07333 [Exophiala oligosperma]